MKTMDTKDHLHFIAKTNYDKPLDSLKYRYRIYRNKFNKVITQTKNDYLQNRLNDNKYDNKTMWQTIKQISNGFYNRETLNTAINVELRIT